MASKKTPIKLLFRCIRTGKANTRPILNNFTNSKKVVILPKGFQSIWINEAKNLKMSIKDITFINQDKLENFEKYKNIIENKSVCVVDKTENLYKMIEKLNDIPLEIHKDKNRKMLESLVIIVGVVYLVLCIYFVLRD